MLIEAKPDILLTCLSCPKQEVFVEGNRGVYKVPISISCGATVDFLAGNVQRAPEWVSRVGMEWLYRFLKPDALGVPRFEVPAISSKNLATFAEVSR